MSTSIQDAHVVIDMRHDEEGWFENVCGLKNVVRTLCALQHAGVVRVDIFGKEAIRAMVDFSKHPLCLSLIHI